MQKKKQCEHLNLVCKWLNRPDWSTVLVTEGQWQLASPLVLVCIQAINSNKISLTTPHISWERDSCVGWYLITGHALLATDSTINEPHCAMSIGFKEDMIPISSPWANLVRYFTPVLVHGTLIPWQHVNWQNAHQSEHFQSVPPVCLSGIGLSCH